MQVVSLRKKRIEKQYAEYYANLENYNRALMMVGTAPKSLYELKKA